MRSCANALSCVVVAALVATLHGQSSDPSALYQQALKREASLRQEIATPGAPTGTLLERVRVLVGSYEDMARLFATSESGDDSLFRAGVLAADAFDRFGESADRDTALRILKSLPTKFPRSPHAKEAAARVKQLDGVRATTATTSSAKPTPATASSPAVASSSAVAPAPAPAAASSTVVLRAIKREALQDTLRVTLELDREVPYYAERIDGPPRVFVDLPNTRAADNLKDATIPFPDGVVKQVRIGRQLNMRTRVVLDLNGAGGHSVYAV